MENIYENRYKITGSKITGGTFPKNIIQIYQARTKTEAKNLAKEEGIKINKIIRIKDSDKKKGIDLRI